MSREQHILSLERIVELARQVAFRHIRHKSDAEEVAGDALLAMCRLMDVSDMTPMQVIDRTRWACMDWVRNNGPRTRHDNRRVHAIPMPYMSTMARRDDGAESRRRMEAAEELDAIEQRLHPRRAELIRHLRSGKTQREAAQEMGITEAAASKHLAKIRGLCRPL